MNIFRLTGDLSHLAAIIILLLKIWKTRSCAGELNLHKMYFSNELCDVSAWQGYSVGTSDRGKVSGNVSWVYFHSLRGITE